MTDALKPITLGALRTAQFESNRERADDEYCLRCGRQVDDSTALWVHLGTDGSIYPLGLEPTESQGWWPVGSDCARHLKGYATT